MKIISNHYLTICLNRDDGETLLDMLNEYLSADNKADFAPETEHLAESLKELLEYHKSGGGR